MYAARFNTASAQGPPVRSGLPVNIYFSAHRGPAVLFHETLELFAPARMAEFPEGLCLYLTDALARHVEFLPHLFQGVVGMLPDAEPPAKHFFLAVRQGVQHPADLLMQVLSYGRIERRGHLLVLNKVTEVAVLFLADRRLEGDRFLGDLHDLAHLLHRQAHGGGDLFGGRLSAEFLHEAARRTDKLVHGLDHMDRDADRAGLVGNGPCNCLPDPPRRVSAEFIPALPLKLVHRFHEADIPFLDQVKELEPPVGVFLGDGDHEAQIRLDKFALGPLGALLGPFVGPERLFNILSRYPAFRIHLPDPFAGIPIRFLRFEELVLPHLEPASRVFEFRLPGAYPSEKFLQARNIQARLLLDSMDLPFGQEHFVHHLPDLHDHPVRLPAVQIKGLQFIKERVPHRLRLFAQFFFLRLAAPAAVYVVDKRVQALAVPVDLADQFDHPGMEFFFILPLEIFKIVFARMNHLVNADLALSQFITEVVDLLEREGQTVDNLSGLAFALFYTFGDGHFALF